VLGFDPFVAPTPSSGGYIGAVGEVSIRALNQETSKVLARVKGGEEITLTERGE
jgi:hypothetical protein